jgi:uncharacterized protein (TIRG00374 family)
MADRTTKLEDVQARSSPRPRHAWRIAAAVAVFAALAAVVVWRLRAGNFRWSEFAASFHDVNWWWFALCLVLNFAAYLVRALRWEVMLRPVRAGVSVWTIFKATLIGFTALVLLGRPGELVRPYLIATKERMPFSSQMAAWFLERIFDLLSVLAIFSFALTRIPPEAVALHPTLDRVLSIGGWIAGALAIVCFTLLFILGRYPDRARQRLNSAFSLLSGSLRTRLEAFFSTFIAGMQSVSTRGLLARIAGYTVLEWLVIVGTTWCVLKAFPATTHLGPTAVCIFLGFVAFGSMVQIPGIGGGPQVAGAVALSQILGVRVEPAAAVSLVFWFVSFVAVVPAGIALALVEGLNWGKLNHLKDEI